RMLCVTEENENLRQMVEDMKIINRAKFLLISCLNMSETQAHRYLEKQAMDLRISKLQVAKQVIQTYEN
ncbi:MAG: ANTAR domain-containing protein, partial [Ruminococcus sp.]|nr:ANTAR domain-containing protein [Ruminococcus sp.]